MEEGGRDKMGGRKGERKRRESGGSTINLSPGLV